jgi:hypothetical protein
MRCGASGSRLFPSACWHASRQGSSGPAAVTGRPDRSFCKMGQMEANSRRRTGRRPWRSAGKLWVEGLALLLLAVAGAALPAAADEPNQAALVIQFSADRIETQCISFEGQEIAGNEFLSRSGLNLVIDATSGLGITVCQIEGQGCAFPAEHCFCQCMGGDACRYWNYFYRESDDQAWTYSPLGALLRQVQPGSVEAWVWGDGQTPPDEALTFEAVCSSAGPAEPSPSPSPLPGNRTAVTTAQTAPTPVTAAQPAPTLAPATPLVTAMSTTVPSSTPQPAASPTLASPGAPAEPASYGTFALLVLGLLLIGVLVWIRRR